jgi:pimeloyl-ACP methyl ester carboxylesterase
MRVRTRCTTPFNQFAAFTQDAEDNKALLAKGKLDIPVLAVGAERSFGAGMPTSLRFAANHVESEIVPNSGHWVMEENPESTTAIVLKFLGG